jgi:hypothetical protein
VLCALGFAVPFADGAVLTGSFASIPKGTAVDLTSEGALDWVHWGLYTDTSLDRKANVTPQISDFSLTFPSNFFGFAYQFSDNWNGYSWKDGTPDTSVTNTTTGVYTVGFAHGFQFSVPAATTVNTLKVYVGTYGASGKFQASLSDNSAVAYTDTSLTNLANGPSGVYTVNFAGRSPGAKLNIKWSVAFMEDPTYGNVTLQSAVLTATNANNPPFAEITSPVENSTFNAGANISIVANAIDFDGTIAKVEFFQGATKLGEDSTSPYDFTWNSVPPGHYYLSAVATDNKGATSGSAPIEIFVNSSGGSLSGALTKPPTLTNSVSLTAEGISDWAHWGLATNSLFNHKALVVRQISDFTKIGSDPVYLYNDNYTAFNWSDGTPTPAANSVSNGVFTTGSTNGFQITVPADTTTRRIKVYVGLYAAMGNFQAWLSDFSAKAYTDMSLSNFYDNAYGVYTLTYAAASSGQTLTIRYRSATLFDQDFGNVTLQGATLVVNPGGANPVTLFNTQWHQSNFSFSFLSETGHTYDVEYIGAFGAGGIGTWSLLTSIAGTGSTINFTNRNLTATQRFYRVGAR